MKLRKNLHVLLTAIFIIVLTFSGSQSVSAQTAAPYSVTGWFSIIWGDSAIGSPAAESIYTLTDNGGQITRLLMDETLAQSVGGIMALDRQYITVEGAWADPKADQSGPIPLKVTDIAFAPLQGTAHANANISPAVTGSRPFISIMCKFSDVATEPNNLAFFQGMYANVKPGLDHYWREVSYDTANVAGSSASGWFVLPHTEAYYNPGHVSQGTNLGLLAADCTAAADASVNFALYQNGGINMMFNTDFDNGWAWGGSRFLTLDGVSQVWPITWEPPWSYTNVAVIEHEMGHAFGLPHSSGTYGQTYDNIWDVMSDTWANCSNSTDPTYGCLGQHTISYHKDRLGWIPSGQKYTAPAGASTITLEQLALPTTANYKMAQIPIGGSTTHFYTVEARRLTGYDIKLPGAAVIIHEVDTTRSRPANVIDSDGNGNTNDAGAMWTVGEIFTDASNGISVTVLSVTSTGFQISIASGVAGCSNTASGNSAMNFQDDYVNDQLVAGEPADKIGSLFGVASGGDTTGVFRPSNGLLYLKNANTTGFADVSINYGISSDCPVVGDWDGNGTATIGIYRNGVFYLRNSNTLGFADLVFAFGVPGDQPIAGDWDNNGTDTIGVYRDSANAFELRNSNTAGAPDITFLLGIPGDIGIAGDWNGDGMDTTGVFRPSNGVIFLKNANTSGFADVALNYGIAGDQPVTGDWDNNGTDTIGVYRNATFYLRNSNTIGFADLVFALGIPGDLPIAGNWDGIP